jgi:glycosyltransferase involved in cell wall biosynthesis
MGFACATEAVSEARMKVVHLSSGHRADEVRVFRKECRALARAGFDVTLIVPGDPDFTPAGIDVVRDGVRTITVARPVTRLKRFVVTPMAIFMKGLRRNGSLYHFHDPELIPMGFLLRVLGKRVVYDVHEDVPRDILVKQWIPRVLRRPVAALMGLIEWIAGHTFSGIVAATPVIARRFPPERVALVQNFAFTSEPFVRERRPVASRRAVVYVGTIDEDRYALEMVDAIARVKRFSDVRLIIAGRAPPDPLMRQMMASPGWQRVDFRGLLDHNGVRGVLAEARVGLVCFRPQQRFIDSQPVKLFEYMAAGSAVICSDFPKWREIVERHGCGLCVPALDIDAIASAIEWMFEHPAEAEEMGKRGRELIMNKFNWELEEQELLRFYGRLTQPVRNKRRFAG